MPVRKNTTTHPAILCDQSPDWKKTLSDYVRDLKAEAATIGTHGLSPKEFREAGLFRAAVEVIRGQYAATMSEKKLFVGAILDRMKNAGAIKSWEFQGTKERHDYRVVLTDNTISVIEAKGCLDGNNTNIFQRPPDADEFIIWSLCQNPGANPRHNAWSGIHTRLSAEIIHRRQQVDGLIIWDMLCRTKARPCPKTEGKPSRFVEMDGRRIPPPCIYLFPRTIPNPRNNTSPACHQLGEVKFLETLWRAFGGNGTDVVQVKIQAKMIAADVVRKTTLIRDGDEIANSDWTAIKRAVS